MAESRSSPFTVVSITWKISFDSCVMANMAGKVKYAQFLHDGSEVLFSEGRPADMIGDHYLDMEGPVYFRLPTVQPDSLVPVIEVILK